MSNWSRREFLAAAGAMVGTACAGDADDGATTTAPATRAPATASLSDVDHVVILIQENRSFDHYFGTRPGVRGFADPDVMLRADGRPIWYQDTPHHPDGFILPYHLRPSDTAGACGPDPQHTWAAQHTYWDDGRLGGFGEFGTENLGYFLPSDIPYYSALADEFTLCDHFFCSVIGPTTPNRLYAWTATIDPDALAGGPVPENLTGPFRWETYPERLQAAGISWRIYHEDDDFDDNSLKYFSSFQGLAETDPLHDAAIVNRDASAFASDVESGNLPQVSWIVAPAAKSEHPALGAPFPGIEFTSGILGALMANADVWAKTVFVLTFDENGGYFDHVPPPAAPPGTKGEFVGDWPIGPGFRVPTLVASPWSRGGRVSSNVFDLTSTLRLLETRFGVEVANLSEWRRSTCGDLADVLDFTSTDTTVPGLPDTSGSQALADECRSKPPLEPPTAQTLPTVGA